VDPHRFFPLLAPVPDCPGCAGRELRPLHVFPIRHNKRRLTPQVSLALVGCEACGLVFSHPQPTPDEVERYYGGDDGWQARIPSDDAAIEAARAKRLGVHRGHLALVERHGGARDGRALDFGCGIGGWLDALAEAGWETYGIEPGPAAAAIAGRSHRMLDAIPEDGGFDLVVVHHVLEHLTGPRETLDRRARALAPGGVLWISVPNLETLPEHRDWTYVANDRHVLSLTSAAISSLAARAGIETVAHSNRPGWGDAEPRDRLMWIGRRTDAAVPLPEEPLRPALEALAGYARTRRIPAPPPPRPLWRRAARRLVR
jgi:SAM-dependent methyltransferase